jgi:hypothetical protein
MNIKQLIDNEKQEFKEKYGLHLTLKTISIISWITYWTLIHLYYENRIYSPKMIKRYYDVLKKIDFQKLINPNVLRIKSKDDKTR